MLKFLVYFFIGISLSMDAFSISLSLGTTEPSKKTIIKTSIIVGIFHFIMPTLGSILGSLFHNNLLLKTNQLLFLIFFILAINMYLNRNTEEKITIINTLSIIMLAFTVSIDSFSVGVAFGITNESRTISSIIFMFTSGLFTYLGLILGKTLKNKYNKKATYFGIILMFLISLKYLLIS